MKIMGFDPSMNNWGVVAGFYDPGTAKVKAVESIVIQPNKLLEKKKTVRKNVQDIDHALMLGQRITYVLSVWKPQALFIEVPVGSQNARAMCSYGMCIGLTALIKELGYPFFTVTPTEVKLAMGQSKSASKQDMIDAAVNLHPDLNWPRKGSAIIKSQAEHIADAVGAMYAGVGLTDFQNLVSIAKGA